MAIYYKKFFLSLKKNYENFTFSNNHSITKHPNWIQPNTKRFQKENRSEFQRANYYAGFTSGRY